MSEKPKPPARRKERKRPLNYAIIKTLIASGFGMQEISLQLGYAKNYLSDQRIKDPELDKIISDAKEESDEGLNYELIEQLAGQGCTQEQISLAMGYGAQYLTHKKAEDQALADAFDRGNAKGIVNMTGKIYSMGMGGNLGAAIFYMKNRAGWKDKVEMEASVNNYYMEGRPETDTIDSWQQQYSPQAPSSQTKQ